MPGFGAVRVWSALVVLLCLIEAGHAAIALQKGDTFSGQFEISGLTDDNYFVLRAHSPQHGAFTWITGLGHAPGWMTHCTPPNRCLLAVCLLQIHCFSAAILYVLIRKLEQLKP